MEQREFLRKQMLKKTREKINEKFAGKEIHIIKAVNLLSDLESIVNLMKENASEWSLRQPTGEAKKEFETLEKSTTKIEEEKKELTSFIEKEMNVEFPNFSVIATPIIGAKLLAFAGSKKKLCFSPASTIQVLGAEKALFAHIKNHAKSPKHGILFNHPLMQKLPRYKRGHVARVIAGKLSIALKVDYFGGENNSKEAYTELEKQIEKIASEPMTQKEAQREKEYSDAERSESMKKEFLSQQHPKDRNLFKPQYDIIEKNKARSSPRRGNDIKRIFGGKEDAKKQRRFSNENYSQRKGFESQRRFEKRNDETEEETEVIEENEPRTYPERRFDKPRFSNDRGRSFGNTRFSGQRRESSYPQKSNYGPKRSFGNRPNYSSGERNYGERKPYGENRSFGEKRQYGDRRPFGERQEGTFSNDGESRGFKSSRPGRFGKPKFGNKRFGPPPRGKKSFGKRY